MGTSLPVREQLARSIFTGEVRFAYRHSAFRLVEINATFVTSTGQPDIHSCRDGLRTGTLRRVHRFHERVEPVCDVYSSFNIVDLLCGADVPLQLRDCEFANEGQSPHRR